MYLITDSKKSFGPERIHLNWQYCYFNWAIVTQHKPYISVDANEIWL